MNKPKINSFIQTPMKYKASFSRENLITLHMKITMFSSHVKRSSLLWVDNNSRFAAKKLLKRKILWHLIAVYLKQNITWQLGGMKFRDQKSLEIVHRGY